MKMFLRVSILIALFLQAFSQVHSQCTVSNIVIQNTSVAGSQTPGTCTVTFDASFTLENNNGNKYVFIHAWTQEDYPNYFHCVNGQTTLNGSIAAPEAGDLADEFLTVAINNDGDVPVLLSEYTPDPSVPITHVDSVTRFENPDGSGSFILYGITTTVPVACGTPVVIIADLWSSQSAAAQRAHCVNCGIMYSAGYLGVGGFVNCATLTYQASITKNVAADVSGFYRVYADVNGDGYLTMAIDTLIVDTTAFMITGGVGASTPISGAVPAANRNQDLFIVITQTSGAASGASRVALLPSTLCGSLPVTFMTFDAQRTNRSTVALEWVTATEINNSGFALQRNNGAGWEFVEFIPTQAIGGNSTTRLTYSFVDLNSNRGISQYRVRQVDIDGKFKYSSIRAVRGDGQNADMIIYPNPSTNGQFNIVFEDRELRSSRDVILTDMSGRVLRQWQNVSSNTVQVTNIRPGIYTVRVTVRETGAQTVDKVIVTN